METIRRLETLLGGDAARRISEHRQDLTEVRIRAGQSVQLIWIGGEVLCDAVIEGRRLREIAAALMDYSYYARENELDQGYFTMNDGSRVGVCGRFARDGERWRLTEIGACCVRVARSMPGCADPLLEHVAGPDGPRSALILSRPGMGKTTLLRDIARQLSLSGLSVGLADERHELAACRMGVPTLDVGPRTDVMDGCPRPLAITTMIRAMAPEVIVADEIGGVGDAEALSDAARCGVAVVASAHAESLDAALRRPVLREIIRGGAFKNVILLGDRPGVIREVVRMDGGGAAWKSA